MVAGPKQKQQILQICFWEIRTRILGKGRFKRSSENVNLSKLEHQRRAVVVGSVVSCIFDV
jgi:hypothetical protein